MNNILVSIVVPVYNMGTSVDTCVNSLLCQDYKNIEIILIDDGSVDDSLYRCNCLQQKDSRIKVIHTENRGSGPARNIGIENASGNYVYFPDADDKLKSDAISKMVTAMKDGYYDLVVFGYISINQLGDIVLNKVYPDLFVECNKIRLDYSDYMGSSCKLGIQGAPWNKLFDLDLIKRNHIEYPPLRRHQDEAFISRYMCYSKRAHFIEDVLYYHYVNDLRLEWKKYPVDYIDAVIGLYESRKETILTWNSDDVLTHQIIQREFICNVIKALELSFSPKMNFSKNERKQWIKEKIKVSKINTIEVPKITGFYQRLVMHIININWISLLYFVLKMKVAVENTVIYQKLK